MISVRLIASPTHNHLLGLLPAQDRARLLELCEWVPLENGEVLCESGMPTREVYFPVEGCVSLIARNDDSPELELGLVGREGMLGAPVALGVNVAPMRMVVQAAGAAWQMSVISFRQELGRSVALQRFVNRYLYVLMVQAASSSVCQRFHALGLRLARWILVTQDRAGTDQFHMTQELLACRLGVRRVGITHAAGALQSAGLIAYHRGHIHVLDRSGLEAAACGCYAADRHTYASVLPVSGSAI